MMLPRLEPAARSRETLIGFGGLNLTPGADENEFSQMRDLSGDKYPYLAPRRAHLRRQAATAPRGLIKKDALCWVDGTNLYYDNEVRGTLSEGEKTLVSMGARVVIFPDKKLFNTVTGALTSLEASNASASGASYSNVTLAGEASATGGYIKISATGIGANILEYDGVKISGFAESAINGTHVVVARGANHLIFAGALEQDGTETASVAVAREVPDMDFIVERGNRLWGCSSAKNEIYASKLGDPSNFNVFQGASGDSYAVSVGSDGAFTGACAVGDAVVFFKERTLHKILGMRPANFTALECKCAGVRAGGGKTMALVDGVAYYLSRDCVMRYDGCFPERVSDKLGRVSLSEAAGGEADGKYLLSGLDSSGDVHNYTYDARRGLWYEESGERRLMFSDGFCMLSDGIYELYAGEATLDWSCVTGRIRLAEPGHLYVSRLCARTEGEGRVDIEISLDGGPFEKLAAAFEHGMLVARARPRRCSYARIRVSGRSGAVVTALSKIVEAGTEAIV